MITDHVLLEAALVGYQHQSDEIGKRMAEIRSILGGKAKGRASIATAAETPVRKRGTMSAAARKRIADAQRKRWAAFHQAKEA